MSFPSMRAESARKCAMLMGSASLLTMVGLIGANAQQIPQQAVAAAPVQTSPPVAGQPQSAAPAQSVAQLQQPQQAAQAQTAQAMQAPEQVLVTGSLIHGTAAV